MNKSLRIVAILAILPLFAAGLGTAYLTDADAAINRDSDICGVDYCSNYPGGKSAWIEAMQSGTIPVATVSDDDADDMHMEKDHMDKEYADDKHMDKDHMDKKHMDHDRMDKKHMDKDYMDDKHMDKKHMGDKHMDKDHMDKKHMDKDHMGDKHMDHDRMDKDHMEKDHMTEDDSGSVLRLSRANVPATIPLHQGYYDGDDVYFIITDSSDKTHADIVTEQQGWKVELAPLLKNAPDEALSTTYMFTNGIEGDGIHGYQGEVFTSTPAQEDTYSALTSHIHVTWNEDTTARVLDSEAMIMAAADSGEVILTELEVVMNMPQVIWPEGQLMIKDEVLTDTTSYGGGQVLDINTDEMTVTFIAHRGWGPDGSTIYYIVTDATPSGAAEAMGVVSSPTSANLIANSAAVDLFQFKNGLVGTGPLGFQPGIAAAAPGDENYSPMWRIFVAGWDDPESAMLLETIDDLTAYREAGLIGIEIARPMDSDHIVNCPFVDPFQ